MKQITHAPDFNENAGGGTTTMEEVINRVASLPTKDADLLHVSEMLNQQWLSNNWLTLRYKEQTEFDKNVKALRITLERRNTLGSKRPQQTNGLDELDAQIQDAVAYVKTYINDKFGPRNGPSHYAAFGIEHRNKSYQMPRDRERRKEALRLMVVAIHDNGFDAKPFGIDFWTDIKTRFDAALDDASLGTAAVSDSVSDLVLLRIEIRRVLQSVLLVLEANYPDNFEQVRRDWGFQKESY